MTLNNEVGGLWQEVCNNLFSALMAVVLSVISAYAAGLFKQGDLYYSIGSQQLGGSKNITFFVNLSNISIESKKEILFELKGDVLIDSFSISKPVQYEIRSSGGGLKSNFLILKNFPPETNLSFAFQTEVSSELRLINESLLSAVDLQNMRAGAIRDNIVSCLLYSLIIGLCYLGFGVWADRQHNFLRAHIRELRRDAVSIREESDRQVVKAEKMYLELEKTRDDQERISANLVKAKTDFKLEFRKFRLDYHIRLRDYKKELQFWRDTVRKILYGKDGDADLLIKSVTSSLKSFTVDIEDKFEIEEIQFSNFLDKEIDSKS